MATHDYSLANQSGASFRSDLNNCLSAILSNNSNATAPSTTVAYMLWADTSNNLIKIRNSANNAWITLFTTAGGLDVDAASNFNEDVTFTGASANVLWDKSDNALEFADNAKAYFGGGPDLQIYHDSSNSFTIHGNEGNYLIKSGNDIYIRTGGDDSAIDCVEDGAISLYHNTVKTFATSANGATFYGGEGYSCELYISADEGDDNADKWRINALSSGSVFQIGNYNNGSGWETSIECNGDGNVELYHNGSLRFHTTTSGAQLSGHLFMDDDNKVQLGSSQDLQIWHSGSFGRILNANDDLYVDAINHFIRSDGGNDNAVVCRQNGAVELYYNNQGPKLNTTSDGVEVTGQCAVRNDSDGYIMKFLRDDSTAELTGYMYDNYGGKVIQFYGYDTDYGLEFGTSNDRRMSVHPTNGQVCVGDFEHSLMDDFDERLIVQTRSASGYGIAIRHRFDAAGSMMRFATWNSSTSAEQVCGSITGSDTSTTYNTSSDYRLKENNVAISDGITRIKLLKPYRFNWKSKPDETVDGFFAHEVTPAVPEAITGEKDAPIDAIGAGYQMIDFGKLVPLLTAALQEAIGKIETLETKVAALEAK